MKGLGNFNFRGKLTFVPSCGCCAFENKKGQYQRKIDMEESRMQYDSCDHEWEPVDSMFDSATHHMVRCIHCWTYGECNDATGEVFWPAT